LAGFQKQKDQPTLIIAMQNLPEDVHLLLIGEGPLKEENERLAKKICVNNRVHFLGFRNDVERILKSVDIVVLSSNWEGFGLAAVEGMAAGKPVIASNVPGLKEIVEGTGILFKKGNSEELAEIIYTLVMDKQRCSEISQKCLLKCECFSLNRMINHLIDLYNTLKMNRHKKFRYNEENSI
jgi:glycosyltransferase involved in cell wall biosynthesis